MRSVMYVCARVAAGRRGFGWLGGRGITNVGAKEEFLVGERRWGENIHRISETFLRTTHVSLGEFREVSPSHVPGSDKVRDVYRG